MIRHSFRKRVNKYNATATTVDGIRFDSKREAKLYCDLKLQRDAGEVLFFLRQVPFHLPGGTVYRADFMVFYSDGTSKVLDAKGRETKEFKVKKREVEAIYPVEIELI